MLDFIIQWLSSNPVAATILIIFLGVLVSVLIVTVLALIIIAFRTGREITLWGLKIGPRTTNDRPKARDKTTSPILLASSIRAIPELQIRNIFEIPDENPERNQRMKEVFCEETTFMLLLARSGFSYLHHQGKNWDYEVEGIPEGVGVGQKLEAGTYMEVILEDPFSENGKCRRRADGDVGPWRDISLVRIEELIERYQNLRVYFTSAPMLCSLFITDSSVFYDPYHFGKLPHRETSKNNFLVVEFEKPPSPKTQSYHELLKCHFEFTRDDEMTISYNQFLEKYSSRLSRQEK